MNGGYRSPGHFLFQCPYYLLKGRGVTPATELFVAGRMNLQDVTKAMKSLTLEVQLFEGNVIQYLFVNDTHNVIDFLEENINIFSV